jgi:IclR family pca regulon transcriptional regulator
MARRFLSQRNPPLNRQVASQIARTRRKIRQTSSESIGREFVQGLERGFAVINAFSGDSPVLTIADVAERTGLPRAVARRYLLTLREMGYVAQEGSGFLLTPRLLRLGFAYLSTLSVSEIAQPFMQHVVETLHESCSLAVLDGTEIVYVGRVVARRLMSVNLVVGSRLPAHATSLGKLLLAHLSPAALETYFRSAELIALTGKTLTTEARLRQELVKIKKQGFAFGDEEAEAGVIALAVPIIDRWNQVDSAINVSGHASRVTLEEMRKRYLPVLLEAAAGISRTLGANVASDGTTRRAVV